MAATRTSVAASPEGDDGLELSRSTLFEGIGNPDSGVFINYFFFELRKLYPGRTQDLRQDEKTAVLSAVWKKVVSEVNSSYADDMRKAHLRILIGRFKSDTSNVRRFLDQVIDREHIRLHDPDAYQRIKAGKAQKRINDFMKREPPTDAQLAYLAKLKYEGEEPKSKFEASQIIDRMKNGG
jgi:hypothetical protein